MSIRVNLFEYFYSVSNAFQIYCLESILNIVLVLPSAVDVIVIQKKKKHNSKRLFVIFFL